MKLLHVFLWFVAMVPEPAILKKNVSGPIPAVENVEVLAGPYALSAMANPATLTMVTLDSANSQDILDNLPN
jgi:hypothetical protein